jgi:hypothetical protein
MKKNMSNMNPTKYHVWIQVLEEGKLFLVIKENLSISRVNPGARGG